MAKAHLRQDNQFNVAHVYPSVCAYFWEMCAVLCDYILIRFYGEMLYSPFCFLAFFFFFYSYYI